MTDFLLLRIAPDGGLSWLRHSGGLRTPPASLSGTPPADVAAAAAEIIVLVPSEGVLLTQVALSARNRAQFMQALPFAVEDQLLSPVEQLHFAASQTMDAQTGVAIVARETVRGWLDLLARNGVRPDVLLPEALAMPTKPDRATVMIEPTRAVVRLAPWSAFACGLNELPAWLEQTNRSDALPLLEVHDFRDAPPLPLPVRVATYEERRHDPLAWFAGVLASTTAPRSALRRSSFSNRTALNLLDGEFAVSHRQARGARWWRAAAAMLVLAVILAIANLGVDVLHLSRASARMDTLMQAAVHQAFPEIDAAQLARMSPDQLMRERLERLRGGSDSSGLLRLLATIAPVLGMTTGIQTRGMEYRNGAIELSLRTPDVATLDSVRERLAALPGLKVAVTAANPGKDGVDGRIHVDRGTP